jgi:hypothetical protein
MSKTILFEKKFRVDIKDFKSTNDVDNFVEGKLGRKLEITRIRSPLIGGHRSPFPHRKYDIDKLLEEALRR